MRLAVPDLISPSYFPAIAAVELGYLRDEGIDATLELRFPVTDASASLRSGEIDLLAGAVHAPLYDPRGWDDIALLAAVSQKMYWFLVVKSDLDVEPGLAGLSSLRDMKVGVAPGPDLGLLRLFAVAGVDPRARGIEVAPVPGADSDSVSFGVTAADALAQGRIDAFWANGMGADVAVRNGIGRVVADARRDRSEASSSTFAALMAPRGLIDDHPETARGAVKALRRAQNALADNPALATEVAGGLFPEMERGLIAGLVERDAPFYDSAISPAALDGLRTFARWADLPGAETDPQIEGDDDGQA